MSSTNLKRSALCRLAVVVAALSAFVAASTLAREASAAGKMYHLVLQLDDGLYVEPFDPYASYLSSYPRVITVIDQNGGDLEHGDQVWVYRQASGQVDQGVSYYLWNSDNEPGRLKLGHRLVVGYWATDLGMWALMYRQWIPNYAVEGAGWIYGDWYNTTRPKLIGLFAAP